MLYILTGSKKSRMIRTEEKRGLIDRTLRGNGLYPWIEEELAEKVLAHYLPVSYFVRKAHEKRYKFSDFLIVEFTKKIKNTKIARKVYKNKMIKYYEEDLEWIRILK